MEIKELLDIEFGRFTANILRQGIVTGKSFHASLTLTEEGWGNLVTTDKAKLAFVNPWDVTEYMLVQAMGLSSAEKALRFLGKP